MGEPVEVDEASEQASSLAEDTETERNDLREDTGLVESNAIRVRQDIDTHGGGATGSGVFCDGREVIAPYRSRDDIGHFGLYLGNWSGRRKLQVINDHIGADLIARNAAQVMMAQEVDQQFIDALRSPTSSREAMSAPHVVVGQDTPTVVGFRQGRNYSERPVNLKPWFVIEGAEGEDSRATTLIIAARSTLAQSSTMVEWNKMFHTQYKRAGKTSKAYSRLLSAAVQWRRPMHGQDTTVFLNVHFHHMAAKKDLRRSN